MSPPRHSIWNFAFVQNSIDNNFLLLQRSDYKTRGSWCRDLPGWWAEIWLQLEASMRKELEEELWINQTSIISNTLITDYSRRIDQEQHRRWTIHFYHTLIDTKNITLSNEHTDALRWTIQEISGAEPKVDFLAKSFELFIRHMKT